jgi:hypothetical protein
MSRISLPLSIRPRRYWPVLSAVPTLEFCSRKITATRKVTWLAGFELAGWRRLHSQQECHMKDYPYE